MIEILSIDRKVIGSLNLHIATYITEAKKLIVSINRQKLSDKDKDTLFDNLIAETKNGLSCKKIILEKNFVDADQESGGYISYTIIRSSDISEKTHYGSHLTNYTLLEIDVEKIENGEF